MTNETARARRERKHAEAIERQERYDRLSHDQKLKQARERGGVNSREYKRLVARGC
jgi:hypothetical protein